MENGEEKEVAVGKFDCANCGAELKYSPGTVHLACDYCGVQNEIPQTEEQIEELDFEEYLAKKIDEEEIFVQAFVKCECCGASSTLEPNVTSALCPYCANPLVVEHVKDEKGLRPKSLLSFKINKQGAKNEFKKWIDNLWFAPTDLKKAVLNFDHFKGIYLPYWTFDSETFTNYEGERGDFYYVSESYMSTENGNSITKTRQVKKTRWSNVNGNVDKFFDDILTVATKSLPPDYLNKLEPWDLENLVPFEISYLSGFITEKYQVELKEGFETAKRIAESEIRNLIKSDIGGDEQRISSLETNYTDVKFKHLLLPVYVSAYNFNGKVYQFLINGRTGKVQGERPFSWAKITLTVVGIVALIAGIFYMLS